MYILLKNASNYCHKPVPCQPNIVHTNYQGIYKIFGNVIFREIGFFCGNKMIKI